jgi:hypothetical protein
VSDTYRFQSPFGPIDVQAASYEEAQGRFHLAMWERAHARAQERIHAPASHLFLAPRDAEGRPLEDA